MALKTSTLGKILVVTIALNLVAFAIISGGKTRIKGKKAIVVGDSHSAGFGWGWQDALAKSYGFTIVKNLSKSGEVTRNMYTKLKSYLDNNPTPDALFIYGGANDIYNGLNPNSVYTNIQSMVTYAKSKGVKHIYVISGYRSAVVSKSVTKPTNFVKNYDAFKSQMPSKIKNATILPIWEGGTTSDASDGFHLNKSAQQRFAEYIGNKLFKK